MTSPNKTRFLLIPFGSFGDFLPFLRLARVLRDAGHDPAILSAALYEEHARDHGIPFIPMGTVEEFEESLRDPALWHTRTGPKKVVEHAVRATDLCLEAIRAEAAKGPLILVGSSVAFPVRLAQELDGYPAATVHLAPTSFRSVHDPPLLHPNMTWFPTLPAWAKRAFFAAVDALVIDRGFAKPLQAKRRELGLPRARMVFAEWWNSPDLVIGMFPEWFAAPQPDWPRQAILGGFPVLPEGEAPPPLPNEAERFLAAGDPPVVITAGSANVTSRESFAAAVQWLTKAERRGVFLTRYPEEQLPPSLPESILHLHWAPMVPLLKRAAAVVHHGGIGTTVDSFRAAVPQLVHPQAHDQFDNANRTKALGLAEVLPRGALNADAAEKALQKLLAKPGLEQRLTETGEKASEPARWSTIIDALCRLG